MNQEYDMMAHKPIFPLLMKMAIPPMISMLIQSMYNFFSYSSLFIICFYWYLFNETVLFDVYY